MKHRISSKITVLLELDEKEALWLRAVMQNPLHQSDLGQEPPEDREMRSRFFEAVKDLKI
jgi:hypothetical protein